LQNLLESIQKRVPSVYTGIELPQKSITHPFFSVIKSSAEIASEPNLKALDGKRPLRIVTTGSAHHALEPVLALDVKTRSPQIEQPVSYLQNFSLLPPKI
jgi:hypothetical protein